MRYPFGHSTGVDEDQGCGVRSDQVGDLIEDLAHLFGRRNRLHLRRRDDEIEVELSNVPRVDDRTVSCAGSTGAIADKEVGHGRNRLLGSGKADPYWRLSSGLNTQALKTLHREREVRPPLVTCERVNLVDDEGVGGRQGGAGLARCAHQVERLGGSDQERRRLLHHGRPL